MLWSKRRPAPSREDALKHHLERFVDREFSVFALACQRYADQPGELTLKTLYLTANDALECAEEVTRKHPALALATCLKVAEDLDIAAGHELAEQTRQRAFAKIVQLAPRARRLAPEETSRALALVMHNSSARSFVFVQASRQLLGADNVS